MSSSSVTPTTTSSGLKLTPRPSNTRGHADHGWLHTHHTYSFASYWHPAHQGHGALRVLNEDRVGAGSGFPSHSHAEYLIWSYVVNGQLEHKDSLGHSEVLTRGDVQFTSAGTGMRHSEGNWKGKKENHFLQIWAKPNKSGLQPQYITRRFDDASKTNKLVRVIESVDRVADKDSAEGPIPLHSDVTMDASILTPGSKVLHEAVADGNRQVYVHLITTGKKQPQTGGARLRVGGSEVEITEGDGILVENFTKGKKVEIESVGDKDAEFVLFDLAA